MMLRTVLKTSAGATPLSHPPPGPGVHRTAARRARRAAAARMDVPGWVSLGAGMIGGSVGVGVAYPLDTLKTKLQARAEESANSSSLMALAAAIVRDEGVAGFFSGVSSTMAGQAVIKGVIFFVYEACKAALGS